LSEAEVSADSATAIETPPDAPVAAYSFDEDSGEVAHDSAGNHDGELVHTEWIRGKYGSAIYLDGNDDYVEIPDSPELQLTEEFTLETWVRPEGVYDEGVAISKEAGNFYSYQLFAGSREEAGVPEGFLAYEPWAWEDVEDEENPLQAKTWNHLAFTYDGAVLRLYVNGELVDTEWGPPAQASVGPLMFGGNDDEEFFKGRIDEVRIYSRALNEAEVSADSAAAIETPPNAPVAAYSFDEDSGEVAHDSAGNHDGELEGADWVTGRYGGALEFSSEEKDVLTVPDSEDLRLEDFTLEAWVRPSASPVWAPVISKVDPEDFGYALYSSGEAAGHPEGYLTNQEWSHAYAYGPDVLQLDTWSHLALTNDGSHINLYVDGELVDWRASSEVKAGEGPLQIGGNTSFTPAEYFDGRIDEVRVYDRVLSRREIDEDRFTPVPPPPVDGPIAQYSFSEGEDEIAHDSAANHDGVVEGAEWAGGRFGPGLEFDAEAEDRVSIPGTEDLQLEDFTVEAWVRPYEARLRAPAVAKLDAEDYGYALYAGGDEAAGHAEGDVFDGEEIDSFVVDPEALPVNRWSHIAVTSGEEVMRLYVDGQVVDSGPAPNVSAGGDGPLQIGGNDAFGEPESFEGKIDEVRIYNRALGEGEIEEDRWNPIPTAKPDGPAAIEASNFEDIWCAATGNCFAVGASDATGSSQAQVKLWSSGTWSSEALPAIPTASLSRLTGVACGGPASCLAVGSYVETVAGTTQPVAFRWNGIRWRILPAPELVGVASGAYSDVDCPTRDECFAAGRLVDTEGAQTALAASWDGREWEMTKVPNPSGGSSGEFSDVSCRSTSDCVTVGSYVTGSGATKAYAASWDGEEWTLETVPQPSGATLSQLADLECLGESCFAAGTYFDGSGVPKTLIARRSSEGWALLESPSPGAIASELSGISCDSLHACRAVGSYKNGTRELPLALAWDGSSWSEQPLESADLGAIAAELSGISCPSWRVCHAVGSVTYGQGAPRRELSFHQKAGAWSSAEVEPLRRNWTRVRVTDLSSGLGDISCPNPSSLSSCVTVGTVEAGDSGSPGKQQASVGIGTDPAVQTTPATPSEATTSTLRRVDCISTSNCLAVGNFHDSGGSRNGLALRWNGSAWTAEATPAPGGAQATYLTDVDCVSASHCTAVGGVVDGEGDLRALALLWNGSAWSVKTAAVPGGSSMSELVAVSCSGSSHCAAVGESIDAEGAPHPLAMNWNGSAWSAISVTTPSNGYATGLSAVACPSENCFAAGGFIGDEGSPVTFATQPVSGSATSAWTHVEVPYEEGTDYAEVGSISCASATRCLASGRVDTGAGREPWALSWDGSAWEQTEVDVDDSSSVLVPAGLHCFSATKCALAGSSLPRSRSHRENLIAVLDWPESEEGIDADVEVGTPAQGAMEAVSCTDPGEFRCVSVGSLTDPTVDHPFGSAITSWSHEGTGWTESGQPTGIADAEGGPEVADVDCASPSACMAVGGASLPAIASHWDGAKWAKQTVPQPSGSEAQATTGVSCPSEELCIAVGYFSKGGVDRPVAYVWDGESWSADTVDEGGGDKRLTDVDCPTSGVCVAVGHAGGGAKALAYGWDGVEWEPQTLQSPVESVSTALHGVSCSGVEACLGVGTYEGGWPKKDRGLLLRWNGNYWKHQDDSDAAETESYSAAACYSRTGCVATAATYGEHAAAVLAWNGHEWTAEDTTLPGVEEDAVIELNDVSCSAAVDCFVVGQIEGPSESPTALALQPLVSYADGVFAEVEEEGEGEEKALMQLPAFEEMQEDQIEAVLAEDPIMRQKVGGTAYSVDIGRWTLAQRDGGPAPVGALIEVHLDHPTTWTEFEEWPVVAFDPPSEPTSFSQVSLELRGRNVSTLLVNLSTVSDAAGNIVSGEVVGMEPHTLSSGEYIYGPNVRIDRSPLEEGGGGE
ncbi:MAG TPA: LamG domain-containing protein, partial [Solirubrobacterales bacterium]|nr:LamG domain-containing protein [Solirubrobacterales bacterium]